MAKKMHRWLVQHCLDCHHPGSCYFQPKDKEVARDGENEGKMGGEEIKWNLGEKRRKRERDEWTSDAWREGWKRQG